MKRGLLFSISGLVLAGAMIWMSTSTDSNYYEPRALSLEQASAQGYQSYMNRLRMNPTTGKVEEADVIAARQQIQLLAKNGANLNLQWTEVGPTDMGGRTRAILFDKDNPNRMWAAAVSGGIFSSPNGGRSWIPVNDQMENLAVVSLAQGADGAIYAGTGEDMYYFASGAGTGGIQGAGIFKSTDGGATFTQIPATDPAANPGQGWTAVGKIGADPNNANRIYAATGDGLKISDDGGSSWSTEIGSGEAQDLIVTPSGEVWTKVGNRILKSDNGNPGTFNEVSVSSGTGDRASNIWRTFSRMRIAVNPNNENYVYVLVCDGSSFDRVYQSQDGGSTWATIGERSALLNMVNQAPFAVLIGVDPHNPERIVVGGLTLWEWSRDNGWFQIASQSSNSLRFYVHVDLHDIQWHPTDTNTFWVTNDGGVFKTENGGFTWTEENKGYATIQFYKMAVAFDNSITGGTQDNGTIAINPNSPFPQSGTRTIGITQPNAQTVDGDGGFTAISHLDQEVMFKARQYGQLGRSIDQGEEYNYFYGNRMAGRYNSFSAAFADFVTPFVLWENLRDPNSIEMIEFSADSIFTSIGFGNGNTRYSSTFNKPQSSTIFIPESFSISAGSQTVVSDANGTLSGDGSGSFDAATGDYTVDFNNPTSLEIRAKVATRYNPGAIITVESKTGEILFIDSLPNGLAPNQSAMIQDQVQSMFAVGLTAYDNASQPGNRSGGIWMARDVLSNRTQTPEWWHIGALQGNNEVPNAMTFSHDGDVLFVGTNSGRVYRYSNLTNARTEETADIDIDFLVNPPAPSNHVIQSRVIFSETGRAVTGIVVDTEDPDRLIITLGNYGRSDHVYYTEQARAANLNNFGFTNVTGNLPGIPAYDAVFNYNDPTGGEVVLGTDYGIFTTSDITATPVVWTQENNGFANVPVFDLLQTRTIRYDLRDATDFEGAIYAATHGRGIFKTSTTADYVGLPDNSLVDNQSSDEVLELYPNPASDRVNIKVFLENRSDLQVIVRDLSGKMVRSVSLNGMAPETEEIGINVSGLKTGNYIITLINGQDVKTGKLVIVQ